MNSITPNKFSWLLTLELSLEATLDLFSFLGGLGNKFQDVVLIPGGTIRGDKVHVVTQQRGSQCKC